MGAAEGYLGRMLVGSGLVVDAVEVNPVFAASAQPYYRNLYVARAEDVPLVESYGTIICGDVLEHLADPVAVLRRLLRHLAPSGVVLVSLPNVAHLAVRLMLLSGRFPKMDRGILDRSHLHFFTRSTGEGLLREAGLSVMESQGTVVPIEDLVGGSWRHLVRLAQPMQRAGVRLAPGLFAYQWVFVAIRPG